MPQNRFPESPEKRELRRRDAFLIQRFAENKKRSLDYCGMPSVEFLDVETWLPYLRSVTAIEIDSCVADDMRIERDRRNYPIPVVVEEMDVLDYLIKSPNVFDIYNLDFYGGFLYPRKTGSERHVEGLRAIFGKQSKARRDFVLVTTFNVRESGAEEYLRFLDAVAIDLNSYRNCKANIKAHQENQFQRVKLCFPVFCLQQAQANGMTSRCDAIHCYRTTAQLIHFHQYFGLNESALPAIGNTRSLIEIANMPLIQMRGQIPKVIKEFPQIGF